MAPIMVPVMPTAPYIDGKVPTEPIWGNALQVFLGTNKKSYFRIGCKTEPTGEEFVYLGFFTNEIQPTMNCRVVVGIQTIDPPAVPSCAWKIHVSPFDQSVPPGTSITPPLIEYWRNPPGTGVPGPTDWNHTNPTVSLPAGKNLNNAWLIDYSRSWYYAGAIWSMEMRIPVNAAGDYSDKGIWFPPAGGPNWSLYVNILSTPSAGGPGNVQRPWPASPLPMGAINTSTPDQADWGLASF
jgi:hypothetical protein